MAKIKPTANHQGAKNAQDHSFHMLGDLFFNYTLICKQATEGDEKEMQAMIKKIKSLKGRTFTWELI